MLDVTPKNLLNEIQTGEKMRDLHLTNTRRLVQRYFGNYYRTDQRGSPVPENMIFSYVAGVLPQLVFDNPRVWVEASRQQTHAPIAAFIKAAMDAWAKRTNLRHELEKLALDMLFAFGVAKIGTESRGDFISDPGKGVFERFEQLALQPYMIRVEPDRFVVDPAARAFDQARFMAHEFARDLDELKRDERYDPVAVDRLTADGNDQPSQVRLDTRHNTSQGNDRRRVKLYDVWIPESCQLGTLAIGGGEGGAAWVRPLSTYVGHEDGPYVMLGVYPVPNHIYPLSPLAAMAEQFTDLNAHTVAAAREASSHKRLVVVDSSIQNAENVVHNAPSGSVVTLKGFSAQTAMNVELGGTSPMRMQYIEALRNRLDRVIGLSDAQRGKAAGVTATEAEIAATAGDARMDWIIGKFNDGVRTAMYRVGWWFFYDESFVAPVTYSDPTTGQNVEGIYFGGVQEGQDDLAWMDFMLDIEPYSMRRVDPAQQAAQADAAMAMAVQIAPLVPQFPWINWRGLLELVGKARNIPNFTELVLNQIGMQLLGGGLPFGTLPGMTTAGGQQMDGLPQGMNPQLMAGLMGQPVLGGAVGSAGGAGRRQGGNQPHASGPAGGPMNALASLGLVRPQRPQLAGPTASPAAAPAAW